MYTVDEATNYIVDTHTFHVNLTKANVIDKAEFELEYSAKKAYNMTNLFPQDWANLSARFAKDDDLFQTYYFYKHTQVITTPCTGNCKQDQICQIQASHTLYSECMAT